MKHFPLKLYRATLENLYEIEVSGCTDSANNKDSEN